MGRGEFEDIFEDCLSALLQGHRSIEESLSLYPAWRGQLEPLLNAAAETAAGLDQTPHPYARERGLLRFLEAAHGKRRLKEAFSHQAEALPWRRWAHAAIAAVVAIGALAFMSATLMAEDGQRLGNSVSVLPYTPTPESTQDPASALTPLETVQQEVAALELAVREGETVDVPFLEGLEEASSQLAADLDGPRQLDLIGRAAAVSVASRQHDLLQTLSEGSTGTRARAISASLAAADDVLEKLGAAPTPPQQ